LLAPAGAAVAATLMLLRLHFEPPAVPAYSLGSAAAPAPQIVRRGGSFALDLRPVSPVVGAIGAKGFLVQLAGDPAAEHPKEDRVRPWDLPFTMDVDGTVHIAGPVDTLFAGVPDGRWEAAVAVGRPEMLPTAPLDVLRARRGKSPDAWHLVWEPIVLRPAGP
jgi:hypothetical protein